MELLTTGGDELGTGCDLFQAMPTIFLEGLRSTV